MAFSDPVSVTIGDPISLPRTGSGIDAGSFRSNDGNTILNIGHMYGRRSRRTVRLSHAKIAPDPLISAQNVRHSMSTYIVVDTPVTGFDVGEAKVVVEALTGFLTASSGAAITKLLGGES